ncbi:MAG: hypothetical protein HC794_05815 [Nitrospiraceae bacterium]|nr:hypothetical protein [Nitrospiraceae bacterium]
MFTWDERRLVTFGRLAGDIVVFSGIEDLQISDTLCARDKPDGLPPLKVDDDCPSWT